MKAKAPWKPEGLCKECPHDSSDRLTIASLPLIVGFTLLLLVSFVVTLLTHEYAYLWSAARLTPLVGLGYGYELYYGLNDGPLLSTMYGPMAYLPFVPAMLASSPTNILIVGHLVGLILGLGPVVIVLFKEVQFQRLPMYRVLIGAALMILMAMFWFTFPQRQFLGKMMFGVHADSPALAFGALACIFVYGHTRAPRNLSLLLSAVFATLAVWAKQIEVGLLPALALYLMIAFGAPTLIRFIVYLLCAGAGISALFFAVFGFENTIFNIFTLPSRHPWSEHSDPDFVTDLPGVLRHIWLILMLLGIGLYFRLKRERDGRRNIKVFLQNNQWVIFILVALFMMPMSILGGLKIGGTPNSYHFAYYLAITSVLLFASIGSGDGKGGSDAIQNKIPLMVTGILLLFSIPQMRAFNLIDRVYQSSLEQAFVFAKENPGKIYFPWMPLSTLLADGRMYHFDDGVWVRQLAGYEPAIDDFRRNVPADLEYVVYPANFSSWVPSVFPLELPPAMNYLPLCAGAAGIEGDGKLAGDWKIWKCR